MVTDHATKIDVNTVLTTQYNRNDKLREEVFDMKNLLVSQGTQFSTLNEKFNEIVKRFPRIENELNGVKIDMSSKTTRDELNMIKTAVPNMATKHDLDDFKENCKEFISKRELSEIKLEIAKVNESLKKFVQRDGIESKNKEFKSLIEKLSNDKIDRHNHHEAIDHVKRLIEEPREDLKEFKHIYHVDLDKLTKKTDKIIQSMDNNVKIDIVMEIKDQIKLLADKEKIKELETAI